VFFIMANSAPYEIVEGLAAAWFDGGQVTQSSE
jgi:hypothetical protein